MSNMKLPKLLIYNPHGTNIYRMINTGNGKCAGTMTAYPAINRDIHIKELLIYNERRQGCGTAFLNFAKNLSKSQGYKGRVSVVAGTTPYDPHNPPHIFYRKAGFTTDDSKMLKKIDKCIRKGKQLDYRTTPSILMYYPDTTPPKQSFWQKIKNLF